MNEEEQRTYDRLLDKSQEAFLLAIELYNRPTIRYHAEGCSFFLCNAWELMLKAYLIAQNGEDGIYYPNSDRTLSLQDCMKRVIKNDNDPIMKNLKAVNDLRNTSTHYVVDEYELFYGPIFNECVKFYDKKLSELHGIEISDKIPENYLAISVRRGSPDLETMRARYPRQVVEKLLSIGSSIVSERQGIGYVTEFRQTKKKDADFTFRVEPDSDKAVAIIKALSEPVNKYPYRVKTATAYIIKKMKKEGLKLEVKDIEQEFNRSHFMNFVDFYHMKGNQKYTYDLSLGGEQPSWCYSQEAIDLILQEIRRDPKHVIDGIRKKLSKK